MNKKSKIFLISASIFALASTAFAAEFIAPEKGGDPNVTVYASETRKNLYTAGANVAINGKIKGDLFAAGGTVSVIGDVEEDLNVAGGSLSLSGSVGGDARIAGGNITLSSSIAGDLLAAGGNISATEKSSIGGDVVIGGGNVILNGPVKGNLKAGSGNITINSKVEGDVAIYSSGNRKSGVVVFGPKAEVMGKIRHHGKNQAIIKDGAKVGPIDFIPVTGGRTVQRSFVGLLTLAFLIKLAAWFAAGMILIKYRKNALQKIADSIKTKPVENLGLGLAGLVVIPLITILLAVFLVGYYIAGILALWYLLILMFAGLISALFLGAWVIKLINKTENFTFDWKSVILGVILLSVLRFIPILGWPACFAIFLITLGSLLRAAKQKWADDN